MKCVMCGGITTANPGLSVPLDVSVPGLWISGVTVHTCQSCGETYTELPPAEELLSAVTDMVVQKPGPLLGTDIRFLRKRLGWSTKDFAEQFCVHITTVSKWENGAVGMDAFKDKVLRTFALRGPMLTDYGHDVDPQQPKPYRVYVPTFTTPVPAETRNAAPMSRKRGRAASNG